MAEVLFHNARVYPKADGEEVADCFTVEEGRVVSVGEPVAASRRVDLGGRLVMPGFIDCHTHLVWAGDRADEFALRQAGSDYAAIARAGGGILSTVKAVQAADEDTLVALALPRLRALAAEGVTCVEIKSGYGLDLDAELKMLRAIRRLGEQQPLRVRATFLGAHTVPRNRSRADYLDEVVTRMLPAIAEQQLADAVDIYVEEIAFSTGDMERLFTAARALGFALRAHTGQLSDGGATAAACRLGARSCDHLEYADDEAVGAMAQHGAVAVLLPGAWYCLRETRLPPVASLRAHGVPMAVASDANPGTSPVVSLLTALHMGVVCFGLTPAEALAGVTRHAARVLDVPLGRLAPGAAADFSAWDMDRPALLGYQLGGLRPHAVYVGGERI
ncbi:MAG TPA: imidazolonepropionase [Gammaproteobacteria bacterium]|nr:imidazolonepropionase [Gammaproteobacteria bacterium]